MDDEIKKVRVIENSLGVANYRVCDFQMIIEITVDTCCGADITHNDSNISSARNTNNDQRSL